VTRYNSIDQIEAMLKELNNVRVAHQGPDDVIDLTALEDVRSSASSSGSDI
jgi:hypothetical protein